jgi:hypothetical protein
MWHGMKKARSDGMVNMVTMTVIEMMKTVTTTAITRRDNRQGIIPIMIHLQVGNDVPTAMSVFVEEYL